VDRLISNLIRGFETGAQVSLKNNFTFYTPLHPARLGCKILEYPYIPAV
jgi:hypothetical protein